MKIAVLTCQIVTPETPNDDHLFINILKQDGIEVEILNWNEKNIEWAKYNAVIIRTTWDYQKRFSEFSDVINKISKDTMLLNPIDVINWNIDKKYLIELQNQNLPTVPSRWFSDLTKENIASCFDDLNQGQGIIVKPTISASSQGIQKINSVDELQEQQNEKDWLVQPFIPSIEEFGEYSLLYYSKEFSHAICKLPKAGEYRSQEEFGSSLSAWTPDKEALKLAEHILEIIPKNHLYARIDLIKKPNSNQYYIMEVEMIEPAMFLRFSDNAASNFANAIRKIIRTQDIQKP